nr:PREDICTED: uncharacterized protein LOC109029791 [Bemisia tabaci]
MILLLWYACLVLILSVLSARGIIPYGPTEVQQLSPCNSVVKLPSNFQSTTIFQLDALDRPAQPATEDFNVTSCAFIFEGPQNATLTFQLFGVTIMRDPDFPNNTAPCLATPTKSNIQLYDYTADGNLQLISVNCQNETWSERISTTSNIGVLTSTISGHFALSVQKVYAAQELVEPILSLPFE